MMASIDECTEGVPTDTMATTAARLASIAACQDNHDDGFQSLMNLRRTFIECLIKTFSGMFPELKEMDFDALMPMPSVPRHRVKCWWTDETLGAPSFDLPGLDVLVTTLRRVPEAETRDSSKKVNVFSEFMDHVVDCVLKKKISVIQASALIVVVEQEIVDVSVDQVVSKISMMYKEWDPQWFQSCLYASYCPYWAAGGKTDAMPSHWNPAIAVHHVLEVVSSQTISIMLFWRNVTNLLVQFISDFRIPVDSSVMAVLKCVRTGIVTKAFAEANISDAHKRFQQSMVVDSGMFPHLTLSLVVDEFTPTWSVPGDGEAVFVGAAGSQTAGDRDRTTSFLLSEALRRLGDVYDMLATYMGARGNGPPAMDRHTFVTLLTRYAFSDGATRVRDMFMVTLRQVSKIKQASGSLFQVLRNHKTRCGGSWPRNIDIMKDLCPPGTFPDQITEEEANGARLVAEKRRCLKIEAAALRKNTTERKMRQAQRGSSAILRDAVTASLKRASAVEIRDEGDAPDVKKFRSKKRRDGSKCRSAASAADFELVQPVASIPKAVASFSMSNYLSGHVEASPAMSTPHTDVAHSGHATPVAGFERATPATFPAAPVFQAVRDPFEMGHDELSRA